MIFQSSVHSIAPGIWTIPTQMHFWIFACRMISKGIAAALLSEAFSRAKALGEKKAYVISDLPLYEKLGFQKAQHYSFYRKEK